MMDRQADLMIPVEDAPPGRILDGDGRLRPWVVAALLIGATAIAVLGQVQAVGMFGLGFPQSTAEAAWGWIGAKVPLCAMVWVIAIRDA